MTFTLPPSLARSIEYEAAPGQNPVSVAPRSGFTAKRSARVAHIRSCGGIRRWFIDPKLKPPQALQAGDTAELCEALAQGQRLFEIEQGHVPRSAPRRQDELTTGPHLRPILSHAWITYLRVQKSNGDRHAE